MALLTLAVAASAIPCDVEALFGSPLTDADVAQQILAEIDSAEEQVLVAIHAISDEDLTAALIAAHERGVQVYVLTDGTQAVDAIDRQRRALVAAGVATAEAGGSTSLEHGFIVLDGQLVITGAYDWFEVTSGSSLQNTVLIDCAGIAAQYVGEFISIAVGNLALPWTFVSTAPAASYYDPCKECLDRVNGAKQEDFEECAGISAHLAFRLEQYAPYNPFTCSATSLATAISGVPGLDLELARSVVSCICEGLLD
jgi:phosphatidylserine/phosphatidylglycerophosphate/cardiolipin synthase-like enzyme